MPLSKFVLFSFSQSSKQRVLLKLKKICRYYTTDTTHQKGTNFSWLGENSYFPCDGQHSVISHDCIQKTATRLHSQWKPNWDVIKRNVFGIQWNHPIFNDQFQIRKKCQCSHYGNTTTLWVSCTFSKNGIHARSPSTTINCQNQQWTPKSTNFQHASRNSYRTAFQNKKSHSKTPPKMCGDNLHFNQHNSNVIPKITTNKMYEFLESPWKFVLLVLRPTRTDQWKKIRISPQRTKIRTL